MGRGGERPVHVNHGTVPGASVAPDKTTLLGEGKLVGIVLH